MGAKAKDEGAEKLIATAQVDQLPIQLPPRTPAIQQPQIINHKQQYDLLEKRNIKSLEHLNQSQNKWVSD
jgi:hypothetical protein